MNYFNKEVLKHTKKQFVCENALFGKTYIQQYKTEVPPSP